MRFWFYFPILSMCLAAGLAVGQDRVPIELPAKDLAIADARGREFVVTILSADSNGVRLITDDERTLNVRWANLSPDTKRRILGEPAPEEKPTNPPTEPRQRTQERPAPEFKADGPLVQLNGRVATGNPSLPEKVHLAIAAGNALQRKGYKLGGGREKLEDTGYDCSGAVSYVLIKAGLLKSTMSSAQFMKYGKPGRGKWITIWAKPGHVFMTIGGLRLDTGDTHPHLITRLGREKGPRWKNYIRRTTEFTPRHPPGL